MKLNRKWLLIVALVLSVAIATGGTLAYLTDTDADVNVMVLGNVNIVQNEQERDATGNLVPFTPNKSAMPAVGTIAWATEGIDVNGTEYRVFDDNLKNVIDKIVTVKNTGKSDAFVRTIIALEAPDYDSKDLLHVNVNDGVSHTSWTPVDINDVEYVYSVFTYDEALAPKEISAPSLIQLFLDSKTTNEDVKKFGENWEVLVVSQAVQADGFANAETALNAGFGEADADNAQEWFESLFNEDGSVNEGMIGSPGDENGTNNPPEYVDTEEELSAALKAGGNVTLQGNITLTKGIAVADGTVLNLNGFTITDASTGGRTLGAQSGASFEIIGDGQIVKDENVSSTYAMPLYISNGSVVIHGGTYNMGSPSGTDYNILLQNSGKLVIHDGTFTNTGNYPLFNVIYSSTLEINGGFFESIGATNPDLLDLEYHVSRISTITIKGGTFVNYNPLEDNEGQKLEINSNGQYKARVIVPDGYEVVSSTQPNGDIWYTVVPQN